MKYIFFCQNNKILFAGTVCLCTGSIFIYLFICTFKWFFPWENRLFNLKSSKRMASHLDQQVLQPCVLLLLFYLWEKCHCEVKFSTQLPTLEQNILFISLSFLIRFVVFLMTFQNLDGDAACLCQNERVLLETICIVINYTLSKNESAMFENNPNELD